MALFSGYTARSRAGTLLRGYTTSRTAVVRDVTRTPISSNTSASRLLSHKLTQAMRPFSQLLTASRTPPPHHVLSVHRRLISTTPPPATTTNTNPFLHTSGSHPPVWTHHLPYASLPTFPPLTSPLTTSICIIGTGISGIQTAYELVRRGHSVVVLEARDAVAGESGRATRAQVTSDLQGEGYVGIARRFGVDGARLVAESRVWAVERVGEVVREVGGVECGLRRVRGVRVGGMAGLKEEVRMQRRLELDTWFDEDLAVRGWTETLGQRGGMVTENQATFHPTEYLAGVLRWLRKQPNFQCYTHTRVVGIHEKGVELLGMGHKSVTVHTEAGHMIQAEHVVEATGIPLQRLSVVAELGYYRTYCIAVRVPKGSVEDCLLCGTGKPYKYVSLSACDAQDDYLVVGGCGHPVGQADTAGRFEVLEQWARERFPQAGKTDYRWSGQLVEPTDGLEFIGKNQGNNKVYIVTGGSGNGLTHGVLAGRLIADEIEGKPNEWAALYSPKRLGGMIRALPSIVKHDVQLNLAYERFLGTDIANSADLKPGTGGILNAATSNPLAIYKDGEGNVHKYSALCPHMQGVVCWNSAEKTFDCPVHGSRFSSKDGTCVNGPAKANLVPADKLGDGIEAYSMGSGM